jgi:hypothetical protein
MIGAKLINDPVFIYHQFMPFSADNFGQGKPMLEAVFSALD